MTDDAILKDAFVTAFNSEYRALSIYGNDTDDGVVTIEKSLVEWYSSVGLQVIMTPKAVIKAVGMMYSHDHVSLLFRRFVLSGSVRFKMALGEYDWRLLVEALHANYAVSKTPNLSFIPEPELSELPDDSQETTDVLLANKWYMFLIAVAMYLDDTEMYQNFITNANKGIENAN